MTETKNTKNVGKAAMHLRCINTVFYRKQRVVDPEVAIYFRDDTSGQIFYHTINLNEEVASWGASEWALFIERGIEYYLSHSQLVPDQVISVVFSFKLKKLPKSLYTIECTDLNRADGFDHFMVTNAASGEPYEMWFVKEQYTTFQSIYDALDLVDSIGPQNLQPREEHSDLPWICLHGNADS